jgi:glutamate synthase (NADPH/NADH) small chain
MGKITGFLEYERLVEASESPTSRTRHYREFQLHLDDEAAGVQGARCMDCGIPFCQSGCPVNNIIPDWNDLIYRQNWRRALDVLHSTNNFPEFTGRVCPAPCEAACTLNINSNPVSIKSIEHAIIDKGWEQGWIAPQIAARTTGRRVAVIGSGPAGLAAAQQLARVGHSLVVFERSDRAGGLLRYGIPDFKLEKSHVDQRIEQMRAEGVEFRCSIEVGVDVSVETLLAEFDAIVVAGGAEQPRDLPVPGRDLKGIHFAMDFLPAQNRVVAGDAVGDQISAKGRHVLVIGGGDTGSDCVGTSNRQGAASVTQIELLPRPPENEDKPLVWPYWPLKLRTSSSHEEGCERDWAVATKSFKSADGRRRGPVEAVVMSRIEWQRDAVSGAQRMVEIKGSEFEVRADLVLLAMGFTGPREAPLLAQLAVDRDARGNLAAPTEGGGAYRTSHPKVFAAGDIRRGQSLVVWAIREGRQCARAVDTYLQGESLLPS